MKLSGPSFLPMPRFLTLGLALLVVLAGTSGGTGGTPSCEPTDSSAAAPQPLVVPAFCAGTVGGADDLDRYTFHADAGDLIRISLTSGGTIRLVSPSGARAYNGGDFLERTAVESGSWKLDVDHGAAWSYELQVTTKHVSHTGRVAAAVAYGVAGASVAATSGPSIPIAPDGAWYALAAPTNGAEWVVLYYGQGIGDLDLRFFDADVVEVPSACVVVATNEPERCRPPPGASYILVQGRLAAGMEYTLDYYS